VKFVKLIKSGYFALNTACQSTIKNMEIMRIFEVLFEKFNVNIPSTWVICHPIVVIIIIIIIIIIINIKDWTL